MLRHPHRSAYSRFVVASICLLATMPYAPVHALSSLSKNDAYPMFSPHDPHEYLLTRHKLNLEFSDWADDRGSMFSFSVSAFFQNADRGKTFEAERDILVDPTGTDNITSSDLDSVDKITSKECPPLFQSCTEEVPLLDLTGRTPMIPLVYGSLPENQTLGPLLQAAQSGLFPTQTTPINDENEIDPFERFGFFAFPSKYQKRGMRFDMQVNLFCGIGLHLQTGFASICHSAKPPLNLTCLDLNPCFTPELTRDDVNTLLMDQLNCIAREIHLDICDFQKTSMEEIRLQLFWRHAFDVNKDRDGWPQLLVIPFVEAGGSFSPGSERDTNEFYGLPFGNNKHHAAGITAGLNLDFLETVEIGGEIGYTHFFDRDFDCFRIPNSKLQNNIFPFKTTVNVEPGHNLHFCGKIAARHFWEKLSMFFQYVTLEHEKDCITLCKADAAFKPEELAKETGFKTKVANIGFTYDFSPNVSLGFLWQAPLSQRNSFRSTTVMFGISGYF